MRGLKTLCALAAIFAAANGQYEVPEALVEPLHPKGFRVSIPDEEGISLFAFHGNINVEFNGREAGQFARDIVKAKNGRWTFVDKTTRLKPGDIIYYWTYVIYDDGAHKLGYARDDEKFVVTDLIKEQGNGNKDNGGKGKPTQRPATTTQKIPVNCKSSVTKINGGKETCSGTVVFEEQFTGSSLNADKWSTENKFAGRPDFEFIWYNDLKQNLFVSNNQLTIKPSLTNDYFGANYVSTDNTHDIGEKCTGKQGSQECSQTPFGAFILPPVLSANVNTKKSFSFTYGVIEIRAKVPKGDWMYPEIFLNPKNNEYGDGYDSGQIRIAFTDGTNSQVSGGCILGNTTDTRKYAMKSLKSNNANFWDDFHTFKLIWEPEKMYFIADSVQYNTIEPSAAGFASKEHELKLPAAGRWRGGSMLAPFDKEMYISLGVGVGGHSFEDRLPGKPWTNNDPKAQRLFHRAQDQWIQSWGAKSKLEVDYVKVYAL